jgi:hypothetical protein
MTQKWEYTTTPTMGTDLDAMGDDGWEMAGTDSATMFWKRPKEDGAPSRLHATLDKIEGHLRMSNTPVTPPVPANRPSGTVEPTNAPKDRPEPGLEPTARTMPTDHTAPTRQAEPTAQGHRPPHPGPQADQKSDKK